MVFELVNYVNGLKPEMWRELDSRHNKAKAAGTLPNALADDIDGSTTTNFMRSVRKVAGRISGNEPASLGLHPAVYFYGATGRFQPAAFLAAVAFIVELERTRSVAKFTGVRDQFEEFLVKHRHFINQIVRNYGSFSKASPHAVTMHRTIFKALTDGCAESEVIERLKAEPKLKFLKEITDEDREHGRNFSNETKNMLVLDDLLARASRCGICKARLPYNSISFDHVVRKQDGGTGAPDNGQLSHPYCNTGYKEAAHARDLVSV
jgi:hypothetical protein